MSSRTKTKGSVLIIVLWSLFILSALAIAISGYVRSQISVAGKLSQNTRNYYLARAGVEMAVKEVKSAPVKGYETLGDGWSANIVAFKEAAFGDGHYSVLGSPAAIGAGGAKYGMEDEERKININSAPVGVLKNLFEIAGGVDAEDAPAIAASVVNWREPEDRAIKEGAGAFHYSTLDRPYKCKNALFEAPEELLLVKGVTRNVFDKIKDHVTLYGGGAVNINTAGPVALRSLGMSEELAEKIAHFRSSTTEKDGKVTANVFDDTAKVAALLKENESISAEEGGIISDLIAKNLLSVNSDNFGATVYGGIGMASGPGAAKITFVFDRKNNALRYWRE